jgi:CRP-like cAMP-binding protein
MLRVIRILRLLKLLRLAKLARLLKNWQNRQTTVGKLIRFGKLFGSLCFIAHLLGCTFCFVGGIAQADDVTGELPDKGWLVTNPMTKYTHEDDVDKPWIYLLSLYWAVMTLTTVGCVSTLVRAHAVAWWCVFARDHLLQGSPLHPPPSSSPPSPYSTRKHSYGDITPTTTVETLVVIGAMFIGTCSFGYIVGSVTSVIMEEDRGATLVREKIDEISSYMRSRKLTPVRRVLVRDCVLLCDATCSTETIARHGWGGRLCSRRCSRCPQPRSQSSPPPPRTFALLQSLQERVREYFDFVWKTNTVFDENQILEDLPPFLRDDVIQEAYGDLVREVPMLARLAPSELTALVVRLKPLRVLPSQVIVRAGECGVEMYIVSGGLLRCYCAASSAYPFESFMMSLRDLQRGRQSATLPGETAPREERPPYADDRADLLARGDYFGEYCIIEAQQGSAARPMSADADAASGGAEGNYMDAASGAEAGTLGETDWSTHARHPSTVVAIETSLLLYITRMQFEECHMLFPHISTSVRHVTRAVFVRSCSRRDAFLALPLSPSNSHRTHSRSLCVGIFRNLPVTFLEPARIASRAL